MMRFTSLFAADQNEGILILKTCILIFAIYFLRPVKRVCHNACLFYFRTFQKFHATRVVHVRTRLNSLLQQCTRIPMVEQNLIV